MQKLIFITAILCSSISNAASGPVEDRGALTGRLSEKSCESPEARKSAVLAVLNGYLPNVIPPIIIQYIGPKWIKKGQEVASLQHEKSWGVVDSSDKRYRISDLLRSGGLFLQKIDPPRVLYHLGNYHVYDAQFSPQTNLVVGLSVADNALQTWSLKGQPLHTVPLPSECFGFSKLAVLSEAGDVALAHVEQKEVLIGRMNIANDHKGRTFDIMQKMPVCNHTREHNPLMHMWRSPEGLLKCQDLTDAVFVYENVFD